MKTVSRLFAGVTMLVATAQVAGAAVAPACITPTEFRAGMAFLVPTMVVGIREKCAPTLPRDAYLKVHGDRLVNRFRASNMVDADALASLIGKIKPDSDIPASANGAMASVIAQTLVVKMQATLRPDNCASVDTALGLLDPLPPENIIGMFQLVGAAIARGDAKKSRLKGRAPEVQLCEAAK